jgi:hypothetical protein
MEVRRVCVPKEQVVFIRGVLEASDGVAFVVALHGGDLTIVGSRSRRSEFEVLMSDLKAELGDDWLELPVHTGTEPTHVTDG